jgi:hypothetical protein
MAIADGISDLPEAFARALLPRFPEWEAHAVTVRDEETGANHLEVEVPQQDSDRFLYMSTADNEITIGFD